jgi:hypothetical protein
MTILQALKELDQTEHIALVTEKGKEVSLKKLIENADGIYQQVKTKISKDSVTAIITDSNSLLIYTFLSLAEIGPVVLLNDSMSFNEISKIAKRINLDNIIASKSTIQKIIPFACSSKLNIFYINESNTNEIKIHHLTKILAWKIAKV